MPEALPYISVEVRRLIQRSLDEIYLDADRRTAGDAVGMAETVEVLESLLRRLDVAGLTGEDPSGALWAFQRSGSLPFEIDGLARHERPEINNEAVRHMNPVDDVATDAVTSSDTPAVVAPSAPAAAPTPEASAAPASNSTWQPIEAAAEADGVDISTRISAGLTPADTPGDADEAALMANIDVALSEIDTAADVRDGTENGVPPPADPAQRDAMDDLERELSDLDM